MGNAPVDGAPRTRVIMTELERASDARIVRAPDYSFVGRALVWLASTVRPGLRRLTSFSIVRY